MKKTFKLLFLLIFVTLSTIPIACRQDGINDTEVNDLKANANKIQSFLNFEKNKKISKNTSKGIPTENDNYAEPFAYALQNFLVQRPEFVDEFYKYYGEIDTKIASQTFGEKEKMVFFPIIKDKKVTSVLGLKINEERDYITGVILKDQDVFSSQIVNAFQNNYAGKNESEYLIDEVIIVYISGIDPFQWWLSGGGSGGGISVGGISGTDFNGGSGTYNGPTIIPKPKNNDDPCSKIKAILDDIRFKSKYNSLNKATVFAMDHEMGFAPTYPPAGVNIGTQYQPMTNLINSHFLTLPNGNNFFAFIHTHNDEDGVIKIFSPADVYQFLHSCVANAQLNGNIGDAYAMVITSQGTYMLNYTGSSANFSNINLPTSLTSWDDKYAELFQELADIDDLTQANIEKTFLEFLNDTVGIDDLELYKIENNSATKFSSSSSNPNTLIKNPCPNSTINQKL